MRELIHESDVLFYRCLAWYNFVRGKNIISLNCSLLSSVQWLGLSHKGVQESFHKLAIRSCESIFSILPIQPRTFSWHWRTFKFLVTFRRFVINSWGVDGPSGQAVIKTWSEKNKNWLIGTYPEICLNMKCCLSDEVRLILFRFRPASVS